MKNIVRVLLEEGIDESMIHRVLDLIEEEYEIVNEVSKGYLEGKKANARDEANRYMVRAIVLGKDKGDEEVENLNRDLFTKAHKRIDKFEKRANEYLANKKKKKEDNNDLK